MGNKANSRRVEQFHRSLGEWRKASAKLCVIGPEFSAEAGMPHFHDVLRGVWSNADSRLNPLTSERGYRMVSQWFDWRRHAIRLTSKSSACEALAILQKEMELLIASQCVDNLAAFNGIPISHEIFGNVFQAKCPTCGHEQPLIEQDIVAVTCLACGSLCLPNVTMFGWNARESEHTKLIERLKAVNYLWLLGVDEALFPFPQSEVWCHEEMTLVRISKGYLEIRDGKEEAHLQAGEMARYLKERKVEFELVEKLVKSDENVPFGDMLKLISRFLAIDPTKD